MEREPERGAGAGGAAVGGDARGIEVVVLRVRADELNRAGAVSEDVLDRRAVAEAIVDRHEGYASLETALDHVAADAVLAAVHKAAAVDLDDERRGRSRGREPEIEFVALVRAVADVGVRGRGALRAGGARAGAFVAFRDVGLFPAADDFRVGLRLLKGEHAVLVGVGGRIALQEFLQAGVGFRGEAGEEREEEQGEQATEFHEAGRNWGELGGVPGQSD